MAEEHHGINWMKGTGSASDRPRTPSWPQRVAIPDPEPINKTTKMDSQVAAKQKGVCHSSGPSASWQDFSFGDSPFSPTGLAL